jgi:hypothetical protein
VGRRRRAPFYTLTLLFDVAEEKVGQQDGPVLLHPKTVVFDDLASEHDPL